MKARPHPLQDGPEVERLRRVRRGIERRCGTFEGLCAYLAGLERRPRGGRAVSRPISLKGKGKAARTALRHKASVTS